MENGRDTRPPPIAYQPHESRESSDTPSPPRPLVVVSQRRRSSAAQIIPLTTGVPLPDIDGIFELSEADHNQKSNGQGIFSNSSVRQGASAQLAAVAAFSQARYASSSNTFVSTDTAPASPENLSDPPPRSILNSASGRALANHQEIIPDRLLLSPPDTARPPESRPSSRRALTKALELAREAVQLDAANDDPHAAVVAYGRSVALLSEVMERVRRGEDSTESYHKRRNGRRRSVVAQEEEVRRLKSIHDTYADRMNILSVIYSIPPIPHSPSSIYTSAMSVSTDSTRPSSPTSNSPSSDSCDPAPLISSYSTYHAQDDPLQNSTLPLHEGNEAIGSAMFDLESFGDNGPAHDLISSNPLPNEPPFYQHPFAQAQYDVETTMLSHAPTSRGSTVQSSRFSLIGAGRPRTSSILPPPVPPPLNTPPPAPTAAPVILETPADPTPIKSSSTTHIIDSHHLDVVGRPRGSSIGHKRTGSGSRLTALKEEVERIDDTTSLSHVQPEVGEGVHATMGSHPQEPTPDTSRTSKRDSHPLPPLPSPSASSFSSVNLSAAPGNLVLEKPQPVPGNYVRPRGGSTFSVRSDAGVVTGQQPLINTSTVMGTISQRRSKTSAPPGSSSTLLDHPLTGTMPQAARLTASSLPASTATSLGIGRSRASSQPGRRPSVVGGRVSPMDHRPPLPQTASVNGSTMPRKAPFPSKLNPNIQQPHLVIQTDTFSPTSSLPATSLVPPPPIFPGNLPTTPTSPLPPLPPSDTLRKPYHMMNLLRATMTSKSGGYVTRRLHVPQEVWSQGGAKLSNTMEKVRVLEVLCSALEDIQNSSIEYFGAGNVSSGMALGIGSIGLKEGEAWMLKLEEFSSVCDGVVANFGKKLGVGEGFVVKKASGVTSWGGKLTRQFDKFTNGKNLDSPAAYVLGLAKLFSHVQLLDEHTKALLSQPIAPAYAAFPIDIRAAVEAKLKRSSEFFASVVLTFVIRDLSQLLDKYAKKCEKWLAE